MIWFPIMANFAQPIMRNIAQICLFLKEEQILMKMKTQVDMINLNTKICSFYDSIPILTIIAQPSLRNFAQYWIFLTREHI